MTAPLRKSFEVACPVEHAFEVWTSRISAWWPADHSVTGRPDSVVIEPAVGGRIYERGADGVEHDWGEVIAWQPPHRLAYLWHLGRDRSDATEVEISFASVGPSATRVEIDHRGWERLGSSAPLWRERNQLGWDSLLPHYLTAACERAPRFRTTPQFPSRRPDERWNKRRSLAADDRAGHLELPDVSRRPG